MKKKERAQVVRQDQLAEGIYSLVLKVTFAEHVRAGQFVSLFTADGTRLLPRPISVCGWDAEAGTIRLVYRVAGSGTAEFSRLLAGDSIEVMGPLGNGFPLEAAAGKRVLLVGGGIGIPPMLAAAQALLDLDASARSSQVSFALGYRSRDTYLLEELRQMGDVLVATDDGSLGYHGNVVEAMTASGAQADLVFACGPKVMLGAVSRFADQAGIPCYVSMEERMACGVGVCLGCVCRTREIDGHSYVKNARVCADGPVFDAKEVDLT